MEFGNNIHIEVIQAYHAPERALYSRMVLDLGIDPARSMEILAFWLWLEENGHTDIIQRIHSSSSDGLREIAAVGQAFVDALRLDPPPLDQPASLPLSPDLPASIRFRQSAVRGIRDYLQGVCYKALDDIRIRAEERAAQNRMVELLIEQMSRAYLNHSGLFGGGAPATKPLTSRAFVPHGEGTSRDAGRRGKNHRLHGSWVVPDLAEMERAMQRGPRHRRPKIMFDGFTNNSNAFLHGGVKGSSSFYPADSDMYTHIPMDERMLFVTFSNGYPLTEQELYSFFMRHYGDVEMVEIQDLTTKGHPLFAHVAFYSLATYCISWMAM